MLPSTFFQGRWLPAALRGPFHPHRSPQHWPATSPHRKRRSPAVFEIPSIVGGAIVTIKELITAHQLPFSLFERRVL